MMAPLVLSVFSTFAVGGPQVRFVTLANRLGAAFRHAIVPMDGATDCAAMLDPGLALTWPEVGIVKGDTLGNLRRFRAALRAIRPDVLVTYNWGTIEWGMANALPPRLRQVHIEDGFGPEEQAGQIPRRVWTRRLALRHATIVVPSRTLWDIATGIWRMPPARLRYVPNGIDLARFAPAPRPDGQPIVIGTVASLRAEKNLARLLRAFHLLPAAPATRLVIVGDGPERPALEALAGELGIAARVRFAGQIADPAPCYREFDIFALTSDTEQMPLSVLEAMAAGLPAATTDVGDVRAMLDAANAPFVVARDDSALAGALGRLAADAALRRRLGAANRAKAERDFDEDAMVEAYRRLFAGVPG
jgi:glycosyltransferase involved in cell wall biosynthesis